MNTKSITGIIIILVLAAIAVGAVLYMDKDIEPNGATIDLSENNNPSIDEASDEELIDIEANLEAEVEELEEQEAELEAEIQTLEA